MTIYDLVLQGSEATESNAIDTALGLDWGSEETREGSTLHTQYIDTVNGIDIFHQYGADYYMFAPSKDDN